MNEPGTAQPGRPARTTVWKVGLPVTAALSAAYAVVAFLALYLSAFCGDGGQAGLPACLTAFWGLVGCAGLTLLVPLVFGVWSARAVDNRQAGRRLAICTGGYLLPAIWFLALLMSYFHQGARPLTARPLIRWTPALFTNPRDNNHAHLIRARPGTDPGKPRRRRVPRRAA